MKIKIFLLLFFLLSQPAHAASTKEKKQIRKSWFLSAVDALSLEKQGAIVVDAREGFKFTAYSGSIYLEWKEISRKDAPLLGYLLSESEATEILRRKGIQKKNLILVFADPISGWGEEGRIVWSLRTLGFSHAYIIDGGIHALRKAFESKNFSDSKIETFTMNPARRSRDWVVDANFVNSHLSDRKFVFVDSREDREFEGKTPHGESRGGHLPGARSLHYKNLLNSDGYLLPETELRRKFSSAGIEFGKTVVSYCTGGIRSAWLVAVLVSLGYDAKNYAGSMWEWSSLDPDKFPLVKGPN
ncbi:rhodanese-like protein [Leptospira broomii serovar Hurstbridge str. 5399]|uniref:Rhodanese-like protein n=1 Tax=Leptospira broomii serovar Hurstbridge str. 5399 TaxID=1049789 RepID=T0GEH7_9LEPT|nr:rhodanese-like domain-containing protein [Leptospira broomii]EQA43808.1 rhodanese-like protein [Leptospira broomii serovar Hurstbridge str. 5399]